MWGDACLRIQLHASVNRACGVDSLGSSEVWDNTRICFRSVNLANISILQGTPSADRAAAAATRGSTTDARKATVDMTGLPCWLKGVGW